MLGWSSCAEDFDLALKAQDEARVRGQLGREHLDGGDLPARRSAAVGLGQVDAAHAAAAEFPVDYPWAESCRRSCGSSQGSRGQGRQRDSE